MKLSLVIPCYNEEDVLDRLFERVRKSLQGIDADHEVILVNDGSKDGTFRLIKGITERDSNFKAIHFSRNFGHQAALLAGIAHAKGDAVFLMDADMQDPPEMVGEFVNKFKEGYEVVYGVKASRQENLFMRMVYGAYYRVLRWLSEVDIPMESGDFCLMSRRVADIILAMPERNKFIRGLRTWVGFKQISIRYDRDPRREGRSKYTFKKLLKLSNDGVFGFSKMPLKISFWLGLLICAVCLLAIIAYLIIFFTSDIHKSLPGYTSLFLSIIFLGGVQLFSLGLIGGYIGRIYDVTRQRPEYIIMEKDNFEK